MKFMKIMMSIFAIVLMATATFGLVYIYADGVNQNGNRQNNADLVIIDESVKGLVNTVATAVGLETPSNDTDFIYLDEATENEVYPYDYVRSSDISYSENSFYRSSMVNVVFHSLFACRYVVNNNPGSFFIERKNDEDEKEKAYIRYSVTDKGIKLAMSNFVKEDDSSSVCAEYVAEINYTDTEKNSWECVFVGFCLDHYGWVHDYHYDGISFFERYNYNEGAGYYVFVTGNGAKITKFEQYEYDTYYYGNNVLLEHLDSIVIDANNHKKEMRYYVSFGAVSDEQEAYYDDNGFCLYNQNDYNRFVVFFEWCKGGLYTPSFVGITNKDSNFEQYCNSIASRWYN